MQKAISIIFIFCYGWAFLLRFINNPLPLSCPRVLYTKGWAACGTSTTFDTQPGEWALTTSPVMASLPGNGLAGRRYWQSRMKAVIASLMNPWKNYCYIVTYYWPGIMDDLLGIPWSRWGCEFTAVPARAASPELLAESDYISNADWREYQFTLTPSTATMHISSAWGVCRWLQSRLYVYW